MRDVLAELERWRDDGEEIAVATLVSAWGSAPRPPGARFAMTRSGRVAGSISGGCVEGDVYERGIEALDQRRPRLLEYGVSDEMAFGVGLSCGGRIEAFVEPFRADEAWMAAREAIRDRRPCTFVTSIAPERAAGLHATLLPDGRTAGDAGVTLDASVVARATTLARDERVETATVASPQGEVRVLLEGFAPPPRLIIVGATHLGVALSKQAKALGYDVTVIDARRIFATAERFPDADALITGWPDDAMAGLHLDAFSYVVVVTHDMKFDIPALEAALRSDARYIGLLGSRGTIDARKAKLRALGFDERALGRIHAPIGLNLGGRSPEEIALAIAAEMTMARYGMAPRGANA